MVSRAFASMRKGFTLVELLIAIAIMGLFSSVVIVSLTGVRQSARDDQRISDLKQVQQSLQLYYLKCGMYPGGYDVAANACVGGLVGEENPASWAEFGATLAKAGIGVTKIPSNPLVGWPQYGYSVQQGEFSGTAVITGRAQCYVLSAKLETAHRALANDIDDSTIVAKLLPVGVSGKNLIPLPACDDPSYCVGNIECFYGI